MVLNDNGLVPQKIHTLTEGEEGFMNEFGFPKERETSSWSGFMRKVGGGELWVEVGFVCKIFEYKSPLLGKHAKNMLLLLFNFFL